jgi:arabinofuranan 3-O-arabinosyltransferase
VLLVWLVALIILVANQPGRMIFDTKLGVDIDASDFLARLWPLWNSREWLGTLQDQYIGYAIPMGPFFLIGQAMQLPIWVIERLWLSALLAAGFWGVTKLATALRIGSNGSRLLAGVAFVLWPTFTIVIGSTSAAALPGLLVPWAILPLVSMLEGGADPRGATAPQDNPGRPSLLVGCARSGVAVMLMGGVNAVVTICVLLLPGLYILTHSRGLRRIRVSLLWGLAVFAATAWWVVPLLLQGKYSFNFLPYVEQSATTTKTMSTDAFLRGDGNWTAYFNLGTPWLQAGWTMVANPAAIIAAAVAAGAGLYGLARRDMPEQLWLRLSVAIAAIVALVGYPGPLGGPAHGIVDTLLNGTLAPFRNVSKFEPVIALALVMGIAHMLAHTRNTVIPAPRGSRHVTTNIVLAPVVALTLAGLALPYLTGQILQSGSFSQVPNYWTQTANYLAGHSANQTALVVPGDSHGLYLWGDPIDDPLEPLADSPWVERALVPYGGPGSQVFLNTAETAFESGQDVPGLPAYLARAGIKYVVLRNDLSPQDLGYTAPRIVLQTLALSGFTRVASFGPTISGTQTNPGTIHQVQAYLPKYPAVEIFAAAKAAQRPSSPVAALPVSSTVLVNGGPDSLLQLDNQGVLGNKPAVIAGDKLTGKPALWAVTDGQRRQDNAFGLINSNTSFTYTAHENNPADNPLGGGGQPPRQILPVAAAGHETVAVLSGAASVTASSYGSWLTYESQYDPVNAFDGDSDTAWAEGNPTTPVGQWIQINFNHTLNLPATIGVQLLDDSFSRAIASQLQVSTAAGHATTATAPTNNTQQLRVKPGPTKWLRIKITGAINIIPGDPGAGIREVQIPGVRVTRYLKPAQDSAGESASAAVFSFSQPAPAPAGVADRAATTPFARTFSLPTPLQLRMTASAVAQPSDDLDALLGKITPSQKDDLLVSADSTWGSLPVFGADNLFDSSTTPWISGSTDPVISLSWHGTRKISKIGVQPAFGFAAAPPKLEVTTADGKSRQVTIGLGGVATFSPPIKTDALTISFPGWSSARQPGTTGQPVLGLDKISIPALAKLRVGGPAPSTKFNLACGQGPIINVDGNKYKTAVSGTLGHLTGSLPVTVKLCTKGQAITLDSGPHRVYITPGLFTTTDVTLRTTSPTATAASATAPARSVHVLGWGADNRSVRIGPGQQSYLEVHQNTNAGWQASLNGHQLASVQLDGWQQAFVVPAGSGGVITMAFAPSTWYHTSLGLSALGIIILLVVALGWRRWMSYVLPITFCVVLEVGTSMLLRGTRIAALWQPIEILALLCVAVIGLTVVRYRRRQARRPAAAAPDPFTQGTITDLPAGRRRRNRHRAASRASSVTRWFGPALVAILILAIGGPVVVAVPLLALVAVLRPRWLPAISLVAMVAAGVIASSASSPAALGSGAFGPSAQACALIALAAALYPQGRSAWSDARRDWRPARPLPGPGGRSQQPALPPLPKRTPMPNQPPPNQPPPNQPPPNQPPPNQSPQRPLPLKIGGWE